MGGANAFLLASFKCLSAQGQGLSWSLALPVSLLDSGKRIFIWAGSQLLRSTWPPLSLGSWRAAWHSVRATIPLNTLSSDAHAQAPGFASPHLLRLVLKTEGGCCRVL